MQLTTDVCWHKWSRPFFDV